MQFDADVDAPDERGQTPLYLATAQRSTPSVEWLCQRRANVGLATKERDTPLLLAVRLQSGALVRTLLAHGAEVGAGGPGAGVTALHLAAELPGPEMTRLLLAQKASPGMCQPAGRSCGSVFLRA